MAPRIQAREGASVTAVPGKDRCDPQERQVLLFAESTGTPAQTQRQAPKAAPRDRTRSRCRKVSRAVDGVPPPPASQSGPRAQNLCGDEILALANEHATTAKTSQKADLVKQWSALPPEERAVTLRPLAKALDCSIADLRRLAGDEEGGDESSATVDEHKPHAAPVDGAALLAEISGTLSKFVVLPSYAADAIALWVVHTHGQVLDAFDIAPFLNISSPEPRCGKTLLVEFLQKLCARPLHSVGPSNAAIFRVIESHRPTVILDETDRLFGDERANRDLIGTINAGHRRGGRILRCVGEQSEPRAFGCFAPYVLAGIGEAPDTIRDRAVVVRMQRRAAGQSIARRDGETFDLVWRVGERCARWAGDYADELRRAFDQAPRPDALDDRACDIWGPLFAVAAVAGGDWLPRAMEAAFALSSSRDAKDPGFGAMLLADIRQLFDETPGDRLLTTSILFRLCSLAERPWASLQNGRSLNAFGLARLLSRYGVSSTTVRAGADRGKGYKREDFEDAWRRYTTDADASSVTSKAAVTG